MIFQLLKTTKLTSGAARLASCAHTHHLEDFGVLQRLRAQHCREQVHRPAGEAPLAPCLDSDVGVAARRSPRYFIWCFLRTAHMVDTWVCGPWRNPGWSDEETLPGGGSSPIGAQNLWLPFFPGTGCTRHGTGEPRSWLNSLKGSDVFSGIWKQTARPEGDSSERIINQEEAEEAEPGLRSPGAVPREADVRCVSAGSVGRRPVLN